MPPLVELTPNHCHEVVKLLLRDNRTDPSDRESKALVLASRNGHYHVVELLLDDARIDPSASDNRALIMASKYGHPDIVELLLQYPGVNPSANGNEAIYQAAQKGYIDVMIALFESDRLDSSYLTLSRGVSDINSARALAEAHEIYLGKRFRDRVEWIRENISLNGVRRLLGLIWNKRLSIENKIRAIQTYNQSKRQRLHF